MIINYSSIVSLRTAANIDKGQGIYRALYFVRRELGHEGWQVTFEYTSLDTQTLERLEGTTGKQVCIHKVCLLLEKQSY